jgi:extradiol dioxygenase family protein
MSSQHPRFHLAFPVRDLAEARHFYGGLIGCPEGRSSEEWVGFDFFGHEIVAHKCAKAEASPTNLVDGEDVPVRHFGVILSMDDWFEATDRLRESGVIFLIEPQVRFKGTPGERATCFFQDPSGNALELKAFAHDSQVFAR